MKRLLLALSSVAAVILAVSAGTASAWQKDPDSAVNPAKAVVSALLGAPDVTVGDTDTTTAGIAGAEVGSGDVSAYASSPASSGGTFWVDNTPINGDCPQATYPTIQSAVDASGPNATVKVCPGTYTEQVQITSHIHDGLRLESLKPLAATIKWPAVDTPLTEHVLVHVTDADEVSIRGFVISGPYTGGCSADRHEGIRFENAFDGRVDHNYITLIRDAVSTNWGCQEGDAVAIGQRLPTDPPPFGLPASARVDHNLIDRYQKNGVQVVNKGSYADVRQNTIRYFESETSFIPYRAAPNGVVVFREAAATVEQNVIRGNHWTAPLSTGVILDEAPSGSSVVDHNSVFDNDFGIETDTQTGLEISHNDVFQNRSDGITLCGEPLFGCGPAMQIVVRANDVTNNAGIGIGLFGADSNLLKSNHVENNGTAAGDTTDGIRVDANSTNNQIRENHMLNNVTHDCHDDSVGGGTAGTANYWVNDKGVTENRTGLCK
jgi:nitrous oxidase accessory protein NosD